VAGNTATAEASGTGGTARAARAVEAAGTIETAGAIAAADAVEAAGAVEAGAMGAAGTVGGAGIARTAVDPVCGMTVVVGAETPHVSVDGVEHWFCCVGCRDHFAAA